MSPPPSFFDFCYQQCLTGSVRNKLQVSQNCTSHRQDLVDLLKGIGIITVIAGHCDFPILLGVSPYAFHMPLFFFISGFFLNFKRGYLSFILNKVDRLLIPYYKYWFFAAFACWCFHWSRVPFLKSFNLENILTINNFIILPFLHGHQMAGIILPMWFVTTLFVAMIGVSLTRNFLIWSVSSCKHALIGFSIHFFICQLITYYSCPWREGAEIAYISKIGLAWTFICMGYIMWNYRSIFFKNTYVLFASVIFLFFNWLYAPYYIMSWTELGMGPVKNLFPLCSITGIYFVFFLADQVKKVKWLTNLLCYCGIKSFHIMALHLIGFFLLNLLLSLLPQYHLNEIRGILFNFNGVLPVWYFLFGLVITLILCLLYDYFFKKQ